MTARFVFGAVFFAAVFFLGVAPAFAQETMQEQRARLEQELLQIEKDIRDKKGVLQEKQKERTTLERDVAILNTKISQAQLSIKHTDLSIKKLRGEITDKEEAIDILSERLERAKRSLGQILRRTNEVDETSFVELTLGGTISDLLDDIDNFNVIQRELDVAFEEIALLKGDLSERKRTLEEREVEETTLRKIQVLEKQEVEKDKKERNQILEVTKGQEKEYQKVIAERERSAAEIRGALFGLRDSAAISFGVAYEYAKQASGMTGVRAALILAILTQESNLGENVGSCYVKDLQTGHGVGKNTGTVYQRVMFNHLTSPPTKRPSDTIPFQEITNALGISWSNTPVSCPIGGTGYYVGRGFGGAMGPSQFIPSTWMLYKDRLSGLTGESFPDPWNPRTAIFATGLLMKDNGADGGTRASERTAACRYFSGGKCSTNSIAAYGDGVMKLVERIQGEIDILNR